MKDSEVRQQQACRATRNATATVKCNNNKLQAKATTEEQQKLQVEISENEKDRQNDITYLQKLDQLVMVLCSRYKSKNNLIIKML